ncbi:hypothetical protein GCWU000342_00622 [Shuttleworthella satelles DSM 14600]|uniref:Uncharacterized protein n=1 Tax=Shuttleworthella satelles DSM 14600 TaxID=626523 RepID=C4G9G9_9FIRM|nr:hypothetical protein GCWU000342_00622 [Shuttleworthia satelles DSM 14600]
MAAMLLSVGTIFHISDDESGSGECMQHRRQTAFIYLSIKNPLFPIESPSALCFSEDKKFLQSLSKQKRNPSADTQECGIRKNES